MERRKERWRDFYVADGKTKVRYVVKYYPEDDPEMLILRPDLKEERIEFTWNRY